MINNILEDEKEIRQLKRDGCDIGEIADKKGIDTSLVRKILNKKEIKQKDELETKAEELFDAEKNIVTTDQLAKLNTAAWKLYGDAVDAGRYSLASSLLQTILKQVELTSKKLGELNKKDENDKKIPTDFIEYISECLETEGFFK